MVITWSRSDQLINLSHTVSVRMESLDSVEQGQSLAYNLEAPCNDLENFRDMVTNS